MQGPSQDEESSTGVYNYTSELSQLTTGTSSTRPPATLPGVRAFSSGPRWWWRWVVVVLRTEYMNKCHADLQPRFYLHNPLGRCQCDRGIYGLHLPSEIHNFTACMNCTEGLWICWPMHAKRQVWSESSHSGQIENPDRSSFLFFVLRLSSSCQLAV